ncbi:MAG: DUF3857 domain-containing protein [Brevundimonas sp.]
MRRFLMAAAAAWVISAAAPTWAQEVERAPAPAWVVVSSPPAQTAPADEAPVRLLSIDDQVRFDAQGTHVYYGRRTKVQTEQGLPYVSTVSAVWNPAYETIQVHAVRIIRGDQVIDVLEGQSFQILRRENNLESSMLDGRLTATLQPRDLRVGDILETAFTVHDSGGVLAPHREHIANVSSGLVIDQYRLRASWPSDQTFKVDSMAPWAEARPKRVGANWVFEIDADRLAPVRLPDDLPGRFMTTRLIQFTDFTEWSAASVLMAPLYAQASTLEPDSPLKARIEEIRAAYSTPAAQAAAALRMVQDEVRYLALSMGEGGYVPTAADEVWRSRYGDCKGKTVLLLALLHGLGIEAEAAMVSTTNGDGLPERLPAMAWFNHVLVRAVVDGQTYWMDGTSVGDRTLEDLTPPDYRWALPVRAEGAAFAPIAQPPMQKPSYEMSTTLDASAGLDAEAAFTMDTIYYGAAALQMRRQMSAVTREQLQTAMADSMKGKDETVKMETIDTRYDDAANAFHITMAGKARMSWVDGVGGGRVMGLPEASISIPYQDERTGLFAEYKDLPYALSHPFMTRTTIRIVLPNGGEGFRLEGGDQTIEDGGYRLSRQASLDAGVANVVMTTTSLASELSAEDMALARTRSKALVESMLRLRAPAGYQATAADQARLDPGDDKVADLMERAERLANSGDIVGALALYDAAVEAEPDNVEARRKRAAVRMDQRDYAGAKADYDHAVDLDPADVDAAVGQGLVASYEGRYPDAVVSFSVALRLDPSQTTALSGRGEAYYQIGRFDRSLADFRALKTTAPDDETGLWGELRALRRLGRADEARTLIAAKLKDKPENYAALDQLITLGKADGRLREALPALDAGLTAAPDDFGLLSLRGEARAALGDVVGARSDFDAMRRLAGGDPGLMNDVCWGQAISGFDLDQALADCDIAAESGVAAFVDSRAMVLLHLGRFDEAKTAYDQVLVTLANLPASLYGRGLARLALGDTGGQDDLDRAKALDIDVGEKFEVFEARRPRS